LSLELDPGSGSTKLLNPDSDPHPWKKINEDDKQNKKAESERQSLGSRSILSKSSQIRE
jgi:hypothetical protein